MNVKKVAETNRVLTVDDPSIYITNTNNTIRAIVCETLPQSLEADTLYLKSAGEGIYETYIRGENGGSTPAPNVFSKGPTLPYPNISGGDAQTQMVKLNENLIAIDKHLYALRKELSYWDLYQISYSVDKPDDLSVIYASLSPGEALIINVDTPFTFGDIEYKRGDIIVRLSNGQYLFIESTTPGFYFPSKVVKSGYNYELYYSYSHNATPTIPEITLQYGEEIKEPALIERLNIETTDIENSFVYGFRKERTEDFIDDTTNNCYITTFPQYKFTPTGGTQMLIPPVIKFFCQDPISLELEEVTLESTCSVNGGLWSLTIFKPVPVTWKYVFIK